MFREVNGRCSCSIHAARDQARTKNHLRDVK
jgi:hypothetical protein